MRKGRSWIVHSILWVWVLLLALSAWPSTATAAALFAALVLWEAARDMRARRARSSRVLGREAHVRSAV